MVTRRPTLRELEDRVTGRGYAYGREWAALTDEQARVIRTSDLGGDLSLEEQQVLEDINA